MEPDGGGGVGGPSVTVKTNINSFESWGSVVDSLGLLVVFLGLIVESWGSIITSWGLRIMFLEPFNV